ncbi:MAG: UDP-2,3-diacylglucosamine diphosphatase LpxI [Desulfobacteraceae bacterium]|nr:UDP-2,3-diacylglucosamine diphosphatase LpxI [Desulfobacteraceae bacterium]
MDQAEKRIGLIAGSGPFPVLFAKKASARGYEVCAAGYHNETEPGLADHVAAMETLYIGQVGRLIKFFKKHDVRSAVMIGAINKPASIKEIRPDMKALSLFATVRKHTHDDFILRAFAAFLEDEGIKIRSSTFLLPELLARQGCWTRRSPSEKESRDIEIGWNMAKAVGSLDIGQCVVVANGSVLAVEAIDGTDSTIRRGGGLGPGDAVVVKVCKPIQDFRFDVPAVGSQTVRTMHESGAKVLVVEAGRSIVFDREEMIKLADKYGIAILARADEENGG